MAIGCWRPAGGRMRPSRQAEAEAEPLPDARRPGAGEVAEQGLGIAPGPAGHGEGVADRRMAPGREGADDLHAPAGPSIRRIDDAERRLPPLDQQQGGADIVGPGEAWAD